MIYVHVQDARERGKERYKDREKKKKKKEGNERIVAALSVLESPKLSLILAEDAIKT